MVQYNNTYYYLCIPAITCTIVMVLLTLSLARASKETDAAGLRQFFVS